VLKPNVQETSTTTGTGNFTLAGADENGQTFNSALGTNVRSTYYIDNEAGEWESGLGYMSDATTLVREKPQYGSAALPVNFSAGSKKVFIEANPSNVLTNSDGFSTLSSGVKFMVPSNFVRTNVTQGLTANRIYYTPILVTRAVEIDLLGTRIATGAGTAANNLHLGLYDVDPTTGEAGFLIASTTGLDPSVAATVSGSIPAMSLLPGWYYSGIWCDTTPQLRANGADICMRNPFSVVDNTNLTNITYNFINGQTSLSDLPSTGNANSANTSGGNTPVMILGKT
jgi:hypothetical protein